MHIALHGKVHLNTKDEPVKYCTPTGYEIITQDNLRKLLKCWPPLWQLNNTKSQDLKHVEWVKSPPKVANVYIRTEEDGKERNTGRARVEKVRGVRLWRDFEDLTLGDEGYVLGSKWTEQTWNRSGT